MLKKRRLTLHRLKIKVLKNKNGLLEPLHNKSNDAALEARLEEILGLLYSFYAQTIDMSLERVERFLTQLDNPHLKLPPVIHVAGTNGKGSTIAMLRALLEASHKRVHVMTSPHLFHTTERIRLAGDLISTKMLVDVLEECLAVNRSEPITFFEMLTAASFLAMSRIPADYVILETGMGGRLDATNVVPDPICTIITTISKDHKKFLGNTMQKIAFEKAGIMKSGVPCIIGYQTKQAHDAGVLDVFQDTSTSLPTDAKLFRYGSEWDIEPKNDGAKFTWQGESIVTSQPNLIGLHQIYNCGAALAAYRIIMKTDFDAKILSPDNPDNPPVNPLRKIHWPGRLQKIESGNESLALRNLLHDTQELWCDGGHNDSAGIMLAHQAKIWQEQDQKPLHLIVAMVDRKHPKEFLEPLLPYTASITVTSIPDEASSYSVDELYDLVEPLGFKELRKSVTTAKALTNIEDRNTRILITGSLYFIGTILA